MELALCFGALCACCPLIERGLLAAEPVERALPGAGSGSACNLFWSCGGRWRCRLRAWGRSRRLDGRQIGRWLDRRRLDGLGEHQPAFHLVAARTLERVMLIAAHHHGVVGHSLHQTHFLAAPDTTHRTPPLYRPHRTLEVTGGQAGGVDKSRNARAMWLCGHKVPWRGRNPSA